MYHTRGQLIWTRNVSKTHMPPIVQNSKLLLYKALWTLHKAKLNINQIRVKDYIIMITHWAKKSGLTLTFDNGTCKSIGIIYSLRATPTPRLVLIKWRSQRILSRKRTGPRTLNWPRPSIMWPNKRPTGLTGHLSIRFYTDFLSEGLMFVYLHFHYYDLYGHALGQEHLPRGSWELQFW